MLVRNDVCRVPAAAGGNSAGSGAVVPLGVHLHRSERDGQGGVSAGRFGIRRRDCFCPDTSSRGDYVPDDKNDWKFGSGAGFYLDATQDPDAQNYRMASYVADELPAIRPKLPCRYVPAEHFRPFDGGPRRDDAGAETPGSLPIRVGVCSYMLAIHGGLVPPLLSRGIWAEISRLGERMISFASSKMGRGSGVAGRPGSRRPLSR